MIVFPTLVPFVLVLEPWPPDQGPCVVVLEKIFILSSQTMSLKTLITKFMQTIFVDNFTFNSFFFFHRYDMDRFGVVFRASPVSTL